MKHGRSLIEQARGLSAAEILLMVTSLNATPAETRALLEDWALWGRPEQLPPPGDVWNVWLILAGRGWGKTKTGAEWIVSQAEDPGAQLALVGATSADLRDTMIEGPAGILKSAKSHNPAIYEPSKRRVVFASGAVAQAFSAEEPDRIRGGNFSGAWVDELAAFADPEEAFDMLTLALRLGRARCVITTTPRPSAFLKKLAQEKTTHVTRGSTFSNIANLSKSFVDTVIARYQGTSRGEQELHAALLDEAEGALWKRSQIDFLRVRAAPQLVRVVVAVDPATTSNATSDETGIVVAGLGVDGHGYVLEDCSLRGSPDAWGRAAVAAYKRWKCDRMIAESNQGGAMVEHVIQTVDATIPVKLIHASRGKYARAEPIAALTEQNRIHHAGKFSLLEDQLCTWTQDEGSPDRLDAMVYALTELNIAAGAPDYSGYKSVVRVGSAGARDFSELLGGGMRSSTPKNWRRADGEW